MFTSCSKLTKKSASIIILIFALLSIALLYLRSGNDGSKFSLAAFIDASGIEGREKYLNSLGWEVDIKSEEAHTVLLPSDFDGVIAEYNKLQLQQGFDLSAYAGIECRQFTYKVTNYPGYDGDVFATLYIHGSRIIGGDIHSARIDGFMHALK